ncbi:MAG: hypothetical protein WCH61_07740, partial [bacterium]
MSKASQKNGCGFPVPAGRHPPNASATCAKLQTPSWGSVFPGNPDRSPPLLEHPRSSAPWCPQLYQYN